MAAHITAASPGGLRYDPDLTTEARRSVDNGIWLCQDCAKLVDSDEDRFTAAILRSWKRDAEADTSRLLGVRPTQLTPLAILDSVHGRLERDSNPRFGFSFLHPAVWDRHDPANGDGNAYRHPTDPRIAIAAWGGYAVVTADLSSWVAWTLEIDRKNPGFRLLTEVSAGGRVVDWDFQQPDSPVKTTMQIEGYRIVYQAEDEGVSFTSMQTFLQLGDTQVSLLCRAPSTSYGVFEDLFLVVSKEIYILGPNAAPFARARLVESDRSTSSFHPFSAP